MGRTAVVYFAAVFAAGFALGVVRTMWLLPWLGERTAQLVELPVMLLVSLLAGRRLLGRDVDVCPPARRLAIGGLALALLLAAEIALGMTLRGLSLQQVFVDRDAVAGPAYFAALLLFGLMPWLLGRRRQ